MLKSFYILIGVFLAASAAQAGERASLAAQQQSGQVIADKACEDACFAQQNTCMNGCTNIKDTAKQNACVRGCLRGGTACARRCRQQGSLERSIDELLRAAGQGGETTLAKCTQLPISCSSNSDCTCSGCCGQLGEGGPKLCQPSC